MKNYMEIKFKAITENESFARSAVSNFILPLNPSISEIEDIKTAVSEAVTNCIVHAYPDKAGIVTIKCETNGNSVEISVIDNGIGILDIERALTPFYTTKPDQERSGMGFTIMDSFMDKLEVINNKTGVCVKMQKNIASCVE